MCILLFQWQPKNITPLVLAANRDEFYARPTEAARWRGNTFCGLDLRAGGTWLGINREGRFAAVTNFREPIDAPLPGRRSRGELPLNYLEGTLSPSAYTQEVAASGDDFGPFNLLVGNRCELWYVSNRGASPQVVAPGIHGLSNGLLDTAWPKVERGKQLLAEAIGKGATPPDLLALLTDTHQPADARLPATGVDTHFERLLAPIFIASEQYGTRASTLLWLPQQGAPAIEEHRWLPPTTASQ